jgi:DNA ligase-1
MAGSGSARELVATWSAVRRVSGRLGKRALMAGLFARLEPRDLRLAASWLAGEVPQGALHVGWSALAAAAADAGPPPAGDADPPSLLEIDAVFAELQRTAGPGSVARRHELLAGLHARLTADGREFVAGLLLGELRQGALRSLVIDSLAVALHLPAAGLRRAVMFGGAFGDVVEALAREGGAALAWFGPRPLVPIEPMLAGSASDVRTALAGLGVAAVEWKLDGIRVQVHRDGREVRVFSRQLRDITPSLPELCELALRLPAGTLVLDGEVIGMDERGRPLPFQDLMTGFAREVDAGGSGRGALLGLFFDLLYLDGEPLVDQPYSARRDALERLVPPEHLIARRVTGTLEDAERVLAESLAAGHEGVLIKTLDAPYVAGRRGKQWLKVKPSVTLDLVVLAAEWGHGRRQGFLSNLHLGARAADRPDRFLMLGKTFKGLTDAMLRELTADLLPLATGRDGHVVHVRPERVVEIAFDSVQRSPRYDSGLALRFARVRRFRPDKSPDQATTIEEVREIHARARPPEPPPAPT